MCSTARIVKITVLSIIVFTAIATAQNSDIKSITDRAITAYEKGYYSTAVDEMEKALEIMKSKEGKSLNALMPKALPGWTRGDNSSKPMESTRYCRRTSR